MKVCIKCGLPKEDKDFRGKRNDCRVCCNQYTKSHYKKNKSVYIKRALNFNRRQKIGNRKRLLDFLKGKKCVDCGNGDIRVLEFDHKDRKTKTDCIANMVNRCSWNKTQEEISKCDIRCANCHRIKTLIESSCFKCGS